MLTFPNSTGPICFPDYDWLIWINHQAIYIYIIIDTLHPSGRKTQRSTPRLIWYVKRQGLELYLLHEKRFQLSFHPVNPSMIGWMRWLLRDPCKQMKFRVFLNLCTARFNNSIVEEDWSFFLHKGHNPSQLIIKNTQILSSICLHGFQSDHCTIKAWIRAEEAASFFRAKGTCMPLCQWIWARFYNIFNESSPMTLPKIIRNGK